MQDRKSTLKNPSEAGPSQKSRICDDLGNAAIIGGSAMASSEPFGPVIGAVIAMSEEAVAMLSKDASGALKHHARAKKLKLIQDTEESAVVP